MNHGGGIIQAFASNRVAPLLLMIICLMAGMWATNKLDIRFFPPFSAQLIVVTVVWEGFSAEDVQEGIVIPLENKLEAVDNVDKLRAVASENVASFYLEFPEKIDLTEAKEDVISAIDAAKKDLPTDAEEPSISAIDEVNTELARVAVVGDDLWELRRLARLFENELSDLGVADIDISGIPEETIDIYIDQARVRELGLSLQEIARRISQQNINVSAGNLEGAGLYQQLRIVSKAEDALGLGDVHIINDDSRVILLKDIATINRQFDHSRVVYYRDRFAVELKLKIRNFDNVLHSAERLNRWMDEKRQDLPPTFEIFSYDENWRAIQSRLDLLVKNGLMGLLIVLAILFLFLNARVALWVAISIPVVYSLALFIIYLAGGTINMISMFALIMATGIIVDDSIIVGENTTHYRRQGYSPLESASLGAREMFIPIFASTFTTISSFIPLFIVGGIIGSIIFDIPLVIVAILVAALFDCFFILPGHLRGACKKIPTGEDNRKLSFMENKVVWAEEHFFRPLVARAVEYRFVTVSICLALIILAVTLFAGGLVRYRFFPGADLGQIQVEASFASGTQPQVLEGYLERLHQSLQEVAAQLSDEELIRHAVTYRGAGNQEQGDPDGDEKFRMRIELIDSERRTVETDEVVRLWNKIAPRHPSLEKLSITKTGGGPPGSDLEILLRGDDLDQLKAASLRLQQMMQDIDGVSLLRDDLPYGREQILLELTPNGERLDLSINEIALQLRHALDGVNVQKFYEGPDEVNVDVHLQMPIEQKTDLSGFQIRIPNGQYVALSDVAEFRTRRGFDYIKRIDGDLALRVEGEVDFATTDMATIVPTLEAHILPEIRREYNVSSSFQGKQEDEAKTVSDMKFGLLIGISLIYIILVSVFSSWGIPLIIMVTMPLGIIGSIFGHWMLGMDMSILSGFGLFTLMGIIINDSIVLIRYFVQLQNTQQHAREKLSDDELIINTVMRRLRAVFLTSITTVGGLLPLMFEVSTQAQFLKPMAVSVSFGLLFATFLILLLVPACLSYYLSVRRFFARTPHTELKPG